MAGMKKNDRPRRTDKSRTLKKQKQKHCYEKPSSKLEQAEIVNAISLFQTFFIPFERSNLVLIRLTHSFPNYFKICRLKLRANFIAKIVF